MLKDGSQFDETNPIHRCIVIVSSMVIESTLYRQKNVFVCNNNRDCIRFAFMDLLQMELNEVRDSWNTHRIVHTRQDYIHGIPDELYHLSEIQGILIPS